MLMDKIMSKHFPYLLGLIIISALLMTSAYLQVFEGFTPCPLCTLQRLAFSLLGIICLFGIFVANKRIGRTIINLLGSFTALLGIFFAGRQVWLQHFPPANNTECGVSLQYMLQVLPVNQVLEKIFQGTAECTERGWDFLGLTIAEWTLIWFVGFFICAVVLLIKGLKK